MDLQIANGDEVLMKHINEGPSNAQYTSTFSCRNLLAAISKWLDQKLVESLKSSPFFSLLADECEDVSTQEELSICCRWLVDGKPEEHFLSVLHIKALDAGTIAEALTTYMNSKHLDVSKLISQAYDDASVFWTKHWSSS